MRINAERERIRKYQDITKGPAYVYYKILKRLSVEGPLLLKEEQSQTPQILQEPSAKIQRALYEQKLQKLTYYITDFIKQVVENGNPFTSEHFFMMLETLSAQEVNEKIVILTLKIIVEEIEVSSVDYVEFNQKIKDDVLHKAFYDIRTQLFPDEEE